MCLLNMLAEFFFIDYRQIDATLFQTPIDQHLYRHSMQSSNQLNDKLNSESALCPVVLILLIDIPDVITDSI